MARGKSVRAIVAAAVVGMLLTATSGPADAGAASAPQDNGVAAVIARYRSTIPELMDEEQVPGLAVAVVDGDGVVWQQGFGST